jgi:uncharacterized membrane protein
MIKSAMFISLFSLFLSCNVPNDEKNIPTNKLEVITSLSEVDDSTTKKIDIKAKPVEKVLLIARGSEPGWYAEFSAKHLRLLINNGTDSLHLDHDFSDIVSDKQYKKTIIEASSSNGNASSLSLVIQIDLKPCSEMSGVTKEKSISLRYNNQNFKGCAGSYP